MRDISLRGFIYRLLKQVIDYFWGLLCCHFHNNISMMPANLTLIKILLYHIDKQLKRRPAN
jgi:hypothetical protein